MFLKHEKSSFTFKNMYSDPFGTGSGSEPIIRISIRILQKGSDPFGSGSTTLKLLEWGDMLTSSWGGGGGDKLVLLRAETQIFALQKEMNLPEGRALSLHLVPALGDEEEDLPGAVVGLGQRVREAPRLVERGDVLQHLLLAERLVGLLARKGEDLPEGHAEGPDVALSRVFALTR